MVPISVAALILAGGKARRMGGLNKAMQMLKGRPLMSYVIESLSTQVEQIFISANSELETFKQFDLPIITDDISVKNMGPLAGIASIFTVLPSRFNLLLVVPCDTPFLPQNLVNSLYSEWKKNTHLDISVAATAHQGIHASVFLHRPEINLNLATHLKQGHRSMMSWIQCHKFATHLFTDERAFTNINDLSVLETLNIC